MKIIIFILLGLAILVGGIILLATGILGGASKADYYEIGNDKIPSVKYVLDEKRKVTSTETSVSGSVTTKTVRYSVSGNEQNQDMSKYIEYLHDKEGFMYTSDFDFSGSTGTAELGRDSVDSGFIIQITLAYNTSGYTVTIVRQEGSLTMKEDGDENTGEDNGSQTDVVPDDPWIGFWRLDTPENVEIIGLYDDGTYDVFVYYREDVDSDDFVLSGDFEVSDGKLITTNNKKNNIEEIEDISYTFKHDEKMITIDGDDYDYVPYEYVSDMLNDPLVPYGD